MRQKVLEVIPEAKRPRKIFQAGMEQGCGLKQPGVSNGDPAGSAARDIFRKLVDLAKHADSKSKMKNDNLKLWFVPFCGLKIFESEIQEKIEEGLSEEEVWLWLKREYPVLFSQELAVTPNSNHTIVDLVDTDNSSVDTDVPAVQGPGNHWFGEEETRAEMARLQSELVALKASMQAERASMKSDSAALKASMQAERASMKSESAALNASLQAEMASMKSESAALNASLRAEITRMKSESAALEATVKEITGFCNSLGCI